MRTTTTRTKNFMLLLLPCSWKFKECVKNVHRRRESLICTWSCTYQTVMQFHVLVCVYFPKHSFDVDRDPYVHLENKSWILCDDSATKLCSDGQISDVRWSLAQMVCAWIIIKENYYLLYPCRNVGRVIPGFLLCWCWCVKVRYLATLIFSIQSLKTHRPQIYSTFQGYLHSQESLA